MPKDPEEPEFHDTRLVFESLLPICFQGAYNVGKVGLTGTELELSSGAEIASLDLYAVEAPINEAV
jgi:hypothetical protein